MTAFASPRLRPLAAALLALSLLAARPAGAQIVPEPVDPPTRGAGDDAGWAAYNALSLTPDAALAPMTGYLLARPGEPLEPLRFALRASGSERNAFTDQRIVAVTVDLPVRLTSVALTAGYVDFTCDELVAESGDTEDCRGGWQAGARLGRSLWSYSLDAAGTNVLVLGAEGTAGYADAALFDVALVETGDEAEARWEAFTASVALPLGVRARVGGVTVAPMIAPRLAWGRSTLDVERVSRDTGSGVRFVLGAGVAVRLGRHLGIDAGLQRVQVDGAGTTYGLAASVGF